MPRGEFRELLDILDRELRLITPITLTLITPINGASTLIEPNYQLTHDYLVPSIRGWLALVQSDTPRGRAELRLIALTRIWTSDDFRHFLPLPTLWEWVNIRLLIKPSEMTVLQRKMMREVGQKHGMRAFVLTLILTLILALFVWHENMTATRNMDH